MSANRRDVPRTSGRIGGALTVTTGHRMVGTSRDILVGSADLADRQRSRTSRLVRLMAELGRVHGVVKPPPVRDPYRLLLWEQVAYLADDEVRLAAYRELEQRVGIEPRAVEGAPAAVLRRVARRGGAIGVDLRAERLRAVARRVRIVWNGDLGPVLRLPTAEAVRELARYPSIGKPGAERILLLCGAAPVLALDSNAMRVLLRLGYGREGATYAQTHRMVQGAGEAELPQTVTARRRAHLLLRHHGQTICRRTHPRCHTCPLRIDCPSAETFMRHSTAG